MSRVLKELSIIIPVFNEQECLPALFQRLDAVLAQLPVSAELVVVDDGSSDGSFAIIRQTRCGHAHLKGVRMAENIGSLQALLCGTVVASGEAVIHMDADLQHPPEYIPEMIAAWQAGYDVVEMNRRETEDLAPLRALGTSLFYRLLRLTSSSPVTPYSSDFRLLDRVWADKLIEPSRRPEFLRSAVRAFDCNRAEITFDSPARYSGAASYSLPKLVRYAIAVLTRRPPPACEIVEIVESSMGDR